MFQIPVVTYGGLVWRSDLPPFQQVPVDRSEKRMRRDVSETCLRVASESLIRHLNSGECVSVNGSSGRESRCDRLSITRSINVK